MENPATDRSEATKKTIEAAGGKLISCYATPSEGPGILVILDMPDGGAAAVVSGVVVAAGVLQNVKPTRLLTHAEVVQVRQKSVQVRDAYKPPSK
jgi:hypothetical protein